MSENLLQALPCRGVSSTLRSENFQFTFLDVPYPDLAVASSRDEQIGSVVEVHTKDVTCMPFQDLLRQALRTHVSKGMYTE